MRKVIAFVLFMFLSIGLIGCSADESNPESKESTDTTANVSNSNSAPGETPLGETKGKSDADK